MKSLITIIIALGAFASTAQQYWQPLREDQGPDYPVFSLYADNEEGILYMGGNFKYLKNSAGNNLLLLNGIAMWNGIEYGAMGVGQEWCFNLCNPIRHITKYNHEIYVGPGYVTIDSLATYGIARWNGMAWDSVDSGFRNTSASLFGILNGSLVLNNELIVGGTFRTAGGMPANSLAKWNGQEWIVIPFPPNFSPNLPLIKSIIFHNGNLYVGGNFEAVIDGEVYRDIVKFDGTNWSAVHGSLTGSISNVNSMVVFQDQLYIGGAFNQTDGNVGNKIMRLGSNGWEDVHGGIWGGDAYQIYKLLVHNNALYVSGAFDVVGDGVQARSIAKWDGEKWCALGGGGTLGYFVVDMAIFRDTLIVASKVDLDNGATIKNIAKWTGGDYVENCGLPVAAESPAKEAYLKISPNPATSLIHLQLGGFQAPVQVRILDVLGREVYEMQVDAASQIETLRIPVAAWPPGVYSVQIESGGKVLTRQVVVQR